MYLPGDAARDGLALVQCAHDGDWEGARAVLGNCDGTMVAGFLARLVCDLLEDLTDDAAAALVLLREHAGGV